MEKLLILDSSEYHIAVFKPHNMAVVGGKGVIRPTLLDLVRLRYKKNIFPIHRLDRVTSGITVFAKGLFAKHAIENAFKKRIVKKTYYALCEGKATFKKISVDKRLKKINLTNKKGPLKKQTIDPEGEKAITNFRVFKIINDNDGNEYSLIEACPISGRMHQIRAHLSFLGLPIVGDGLYGAQENCKEKIALCAVGLSLPLPKGRKTHIDAREFFVPKNYLKQDK